MKFRLEFEKNTPSGNKKEKSNQNSPVEHVFCVFDFGFLCLYRLAHNKCPKPLCEFAP